MDLKKIAQNLNELFSIPGGRKLIFWYDAEAEFVDDVDAIELSNAKIHKLEKDNQFYTKYLIEYEDTATNYLIYAPFAKPDVRENHLADTVKYSKEFYADRSSLICIDLNIPSQLKTVVEKHKKFFNADSRCSKFKELCIDKYDEKTILIGMMSVICKCKTDSFEEVLRTVMMEKSNPENKYMSEIEKYDLAEPFWSLCEEYYGYSNSVPSLEGLAIAFFITYTGSLMSGELPKAWKNNTANKIGSVVAFMNNTMNNINCREAYDNLSEHVADEINAKEHLSSMPLEKLVECDSFEAIDHLIIKWIVDNLVSENISASMNRIDIPCVISIRCDRHYADRFRDIYGMLAHAYGIIKICNYNCPVKLNDLIDHYKDYGWQIDTNYRMFYWHFDRLEKTSLFESLRERVENIYTNEYMAKITVRFSDAIANEKTTDHIPLQRNFYRHFVSNVKERVIVIISDAFRYEVAYNLWLKMEDDEKCQAKPYMMFGVLPSITKLGMASLLPHKKLEVTDDFKVLVDGMTCDTTPQREAILQAENKESVALLFDDVVGLKREKIREILTNKNVVYLYHNQIDARGDKLSTENEVFAACYEAIEEIYKMVRKLTEEVSARHFIITSDHGFIYKRDKIEEYDKIDGLSHKENLEGKRFIISDSEINFDGVKSLNLSDYIGNADTRKISVPSGPCIFKTLGGGQNYVHGGASPQEMLIPVIDVKTFRGHQETRPVSITLISTTTKVTSLIQSFEFFQSEPVSDIVKSAKYRICFVSANGEPISNEIIYEANSKDEESAKRLIKLKFTFKNKRYDNSEKYYLVAFLEPKKEYQEPVFKRQFIMDIAFADDFGF
jgi:uncharacterized protein (TIGR02687 family)